MKGVLIFAGFFSASLTAFRIESYKTLTVDSGDMIVLLLQQISQRLAAAANGTTCNISAPSSFTPAPTSLDCNVLWFLSLGLRLGCALIVALVKQWARDSSIERTCALSRYRARIFSYLYYVWIKTATCTPWWRSPPPPPPPNIARFASVLLCRACRFPHSCAYCRHCSGCRPPRDPDDFFLAFHGLSVDSFGLSIPHSPFRSSLEHDTVLGKSVSSIPAGTRRDTNDFGGG
ncbi:hypothetical protein B0H14DRAFT_2512410 [Mycena olivaceomarginata]|nr:hypothetical protein B0H14DRAFT_2512410 [Mycena olivaceomarginata]